MSLPNFIIFGAAKAGTTSLYHYLGQHPQVFMSPVKETNFFACDDPPTGPEKGRGDGPRPPRSPVQTLEQYEALFANATDETAIGEASPRYFSCPTTPQRIYELLPNVKLVAILRNPADRAFSGFMMRVRTGQAALTIRERLTPDSHHVKEGFYHDPLERYFAVFPGEHIKVCLFEDLKENPAAVMADLFDFLHVDSGFLPDTTVRHNPGGIPRLGFLNRVLLDPTVIQVAKRILPTSAHRLAKRLQRKNVRPAPPFPDDVRARLLELYRPDIHKLEGLLDRDLSVWLR